MANGGARPGAGRPKGPMLPRFADYVTPEDKKTFLEFVLGTYMSDIRLTMWVADQLFGKAPQAIELTGELGISLIDEETRQKAVKAIAAILPQIDTR